MFKILSGKRSPGKAYEKSDGTSSVKEIAPRVTDITIMIEDFKRKISFMDKSLTGYSFRLLSVLAREREISQGAFFITDRKDDKKVLKFLSGFASPDPKNLVDILEFGEGFPGQVAKEGKLLKILNIPEGYLKIESGLGKALPVSLIIFPIKNMEEILAVIELASFHNFSKEDEIFFTKISDVIAEQIIKINSQN